MIVVVLILSVAAILFLVYASYSIRAGVYLKAFCRKPTDEKVVALTFDDGPHSTQTPRVLDVLKEYNVKATFFCVGTKIIGRKEIIRRIVNEGHSIGNHSYSHVWKFPFFTIHRMTHELRWTQKMIEEITGQPVTLFRPPFGVTNPNLARAVKRLNYQTIGWDIRSLDTQTSSHDKIVKRISKQLRPGSIILLHDRMPGSDILLRMILEELKAQGYGVWH